VDGRKDKIVEHAAGMGNKFLRRMLTDLGESGIHPLVKSRNIGFVRRHRNWSKIEKRKGANRAVEQLCALRWSRWKKYLHRSRFLFSLYALAYGVDYPAVDH